MSDISKQKLAAVGFASGLVNGLFGAGGGMLAVPMLEQNGCDPKKAHITSVCMMLTFSMVSIIVYTARGSLEPAQTLGYLPFGALGAAVGCLAMKRIRPLTLQRLFSCLMIYFGLKTLMN
ncbi:hypothetical protein SAMN02910447_01780 [Ruminococcus sp. YE71]|uniref:sulfite exporter TauE/SafE family protein n=1 Tax=unclassified Ruminococcus TaxID=2608920 RepID=UPI000888C674|nr:MULTISPECIES: sulfite exporter TauE/SafE family protein [unclassified Ruminococcus]SDA21139.1 hypothetical protein SAMN02910446_01891 [Ruminococcus sp. YE78]SFW32995.1 hypothetical protein SAMN02910447_01780 [Ruminococcus sp. YE71]